MKTPAFILATDLEEYQPAWGQAFQQVAGLSEQCSRELGFQPNVRLASIEATAGEVEKHSLPIVLDEVVNEGAGEIFILPASLEFSGYQGEAIDQIAARARSSHPGLRIYQDEVDLGHPLIVNCFTDQVVRVLANQAIPPQRVGLLLAPSGHGDQTSRAQSYQLMRLLWENLGIGHASVAFVRNAQPDLRSELERCLHDQLLWLLLPQTQWRSEAVEHARLILEDLQRISANAESWRILNPPGAHPAISEWFVQRIVRLWRENRTVSRFTAPGATATLLQPKVSR